MTNEHVITPRCLFISRGLLTSHAGKAKLFTILIMRTVCHKVSSGHVDIRTTNPVQHKYWVLNAVGYWVLQTLKHFKNLWYKVLKKGFCLLQMQWRIKKNLFHI